MQEDVLPAGTAAVAAVLGEWPAMEQFYLAGGTALALHLGHRQSRDLDFFTRGPATVLPDLRGLDPLLARFAHVEWDLRTADQIQWRLDGVSVTLLAYPFGHRHGYHHWRGLAVADARDLAVQKAYALGRWAQARDYLDLHALLTGGVIALDDLLPWARDTYGEAFSPRLFLQQLTYTRDIPDADSALALLVHERSFESMAEDLAQAVQAWGRRHWGPSSPPPGRS